MNALCFEVGTVCARSLWFVPTVMALAAINMDVAHANAMVHPGAPETQAVRAAFFIDRKSVLSAMVHCPLSNGRSINEFVRLCRRATVTHTDGTNKLQ